MKAKSWHPLRSVARAAGALRRFLVPERGKVEPAPYAIIAAIGLALGFALSSLSFVQRLEWALYDRFVVLSTSRSSPAPSIVIVALDEPSFQELDLAWPWPRAIHAALVRALKEAGARTIAFDIVFDAPGAVPEYDEDFAEAIAEAGNVVLASDWDETVDQGYTVTQWIDPAEVLAAGAAGAGVARLPLDPDGKMRRLPLLFAGRPSFALAIAELQPGFSRPPDAAASRLIRFNGVSRFGIRTVSYYQALDYANLLPAGTFDDAIVLVGLSLAAAPVLTKSDAFSTPYPGTFPGVELHANALDSLLRSRFVRDPFSDLLPTALLGVALGAVLALLFYRAGAFTGLAVILGLGSLLVVGGYLSYTLLGTKLPVLAPFTAGVSVFVVSYLYRFLLGIAERRMILGAFKHYLAPAIVESILKDPTQLRLGGATYDVSVIFTDLAGFSTISEKLSPERLHDLLTMYFREMMDILLQENATLDKFIGDAIMVYFGCPVADPTHPLRACRAALAMQRRLAELNPGWAAQGYPALHMRVGMNSGPVVAGNMGTESIFNYTILGDNVNLASRLEGVNKEYGTGILLGQDTWRQVGGRVCGRELDWIRVKGKTAPVGIYELAALEGELPDRTASLYSAYAGGLHSYRQRRWEEASRIFAEILREDPGDGPSLTMKSRAEEYGRNPPPDDWDGVYTMLHK